MKIEKDPPTTEKGTGEDHPKGDAVVLGVGEVDPGVGGVDLEGEVDLEVGEVDPGVEEDLPQNTRGLEHQGLTFIVNNYTSLCRAGESGPF